MLKKVSYIIATIILFANFVQAQKGHHKPYGEIGFYGGNSYYIGDLNPFSHFSENNLALGFAYKYNPTMRHSIRLYGMHTTLEAYDFKSTNQYFVNRNLHFKTDILEVGVGLEINFYEYEIGSRYDLFTPYLFGGISYLKFNPTAEYNGVWYDLQSLNTEGQGLPTRPDAYELSQLVIPFGLGIKFNITGRVAMSFEWGIRRTFTDYIDDVSGDYANTEVLQEEVGVLSALFADRSLVKIRPDGTNDGLARGNPNDNDWYFVSLGSISIRLGPENNGCWK